MNVGTTSQNNYFDKSKETPSNTFSNQEKTPIDEEDDNQSSSDDNNNEDSDNEDRYQKDGMDESNSFDNAKPINR